MVTSLDTTQILSSRLQIHYCDRRENLPQPEGEDVRQGLTAISKSLPPKYFYDARGSQLFEQICELPEYYPTRTESWILQQYIADIVSKTGPCELVELGSGSSTKTRLLFEAYQQANYPLFYQPIDVSDSILIESAQQLLADYPTLHIRGQVGTYEQALADLPASVLPQHMIFFLGSSLGNFTPMECDRFFSQMMDLLMPGDYFLLGLDLQKEIAILEAAYNDTDGITAQFNLNMLTHLNQRFQGNFQPDQFRHQAIYNPQAQQIEMYLHCLAPQTVTLEKLGLEVDFQAGEALLTEISRKFNLSQMQDYLQAQGFTSVHSWTDPQNWFAVMLAQK
ncbi:MAG: L-histidine N(alpha)-methyltransferase [Merismopediaceae bacterium]|nr:L-histidine N(alpha)-methyltransferase [Merismopediaceae bacterium]